MAISPTLIDGFEHGVGTLTANGAGLCDSVSGTVSIVSSTKRTGSYSLQATTTGTNCYLQRTVSGGVAVIRAYINLGSSLPSGGTEPALIAFAAGDTTYAYLTYNVANNKFRVKQSSDSGYQEASSTCSANTWYQIDFRATWNSTTHTIDWYVDNNAQTQYSLDSQTNTTFSNMRLGLMNVTGLTATCWFDDIVLSATSADFPIGPGGVERLAPTSDGTHNNTTNTMEDASGNDIDGSTYYAYDQVDEVPISESTTYIKQSTADTTRYVEVDFADTSNTTIHGVAGLLAYKSSATQANQGGCIVLNSESTQTEIWGNPTTRADYSESSVFYKRAIITAPSGGWSQTEVNALKARMGYSNDVSPVPYWCNLMLQVAYSTAVNQTVSPPAATATGAALAPTMTANSEVSGALATATGAMLVPTISAISTENPKDSGTFDYWLTVRLPMRTFTGNGGLGTFDKWITVRKYFEITPDKVSVSGGATVSPPTAAGTGAALAPTVNADAAITSALATGTGAALAPTGGASTDVSLETGTGAALVPTVTADSSLTPPVAVGTGAALVPTVAAGSEVIPPVETGTGEALAPTVTAGSSVTSPVETGTGAMLVPTLSADATITPPVMTATGAMPIPDVGTAAVVDAPTAAGSGEALAPAASAGSSVTPPVESGAGAMPIPTVSAGASQTSETATGTGAMLVPSVSLGAGVSAPTAEATGAMLVPTVTATANVTPPTAEATGAMPIPDVSAGAAGEVKAVTMTGFGDAPTPAVSAGSSATPPVETATGAMLVPTVSTTEDRTVLPPKASGSGAMLVPTVSAGATITPPTATGSGILVTPSVTGNISVTIYAPTATASGTMLIPDVSNGKVTPASVITWLAGRRRRREQLRQERVLQQQRAEWRRQAELVQEAITADAESERIRIQNEAAITAVLLLMDER